VSAHSSGEVSQHVNDVGAGEVVDGDDVGAAESVDAHGFDVVRVHDDIADVARETQPASVRGELEVLGDIRSVEQQRSAPSCPSTVSLPSPGSHWKVSSPTPSRACPRGLTRNSAASSHRLTRTAGDPCPPAGAT